MKKLSTLLVLLLCMALALPCAAEAYVPGAVTRQLLADVWNSGQMIRGDMKLRFAMDGTALGFAEEDQQTLDMIFSLLDSVTLGAAAGKTEDGVRIELDAALKNANDGEDVTVDAAANLSLEGISLESSLLDGQKVTAKWETLLAMAGLDDGSITMLMALRDTDWETTLPQLMITAQQYAMLATQYAAPYMETLSAWAATLATETLENVAEEGYPTAARVTNIYLTEADVGSLVTMLAGQLKEDASLCALADMLLVQSGETMTTAQLCDALIEEAAAMTDTENPVMFTLATDENGVPLYGQFFAYAEEGSGFFTEIVAAPDETGALQYTLNVMTLDAQSAIEDAFSVSGAVSQYDFSTLMQIYAYGEPVMGCEYIVSAEQVTTADGQPGLDAELSMAMNMEDDGKSVQMVASSQMKYALTPDGGEVFDTTMNMDMYAEDQAVNLLAVGGMSLFPAEGGLSGAYGVTESAPALGLDSLGMDVLLSSHPYDAAATAALSEFALDSATGEDMDTLTETLVTAAQLKLMEFMQALPADVLNALGGE